MTRAKVRMSRVVRSLLITSSLVGVGLTTNACGAEDEKLRELAGGTRLVGDIRPVPVGGRMQSVLPKDSSWHCAQDGDVSLYLHVNDEQNVDVLIVAESYLPLPPTVKKNGRVLRREHITIDMPDSSNYAMAELLHAHMTACQAGASTLSPATDPWDSTVPTGNAGATRTHEAVVVDGSAETGPRSFQDCLLAFQAQHRFLPRGLWTAAVGSRSAGLGFGFLPEPEGFRGWRWNGLFQAGSSPVADKEHALLPIEYRIGARRGYWKQPQSVEQSESRDAAQVSAQHILAHLTPIAADGVRDASPTYVTILCATSGDGCIQGAAVQTFLSGTQISPNTRSLAPDCQRESVYELGQRFGLTIRNNEQLRF